MIIVISHDIEDEDFTGLRVEPAWQALPAVQAGGVMPVQGRAWANFGPLGVQVLLGELRQAVGL